MDNTKLAELIAKQHEQTKTSKFDRRDITSQQIEEILCVNLIHPEDGDRISGTVSETESDQSNESNEVNQVIEVNESTYTEVEALFKPVHLEVMSNEDFSKALEIMQSEESLLMPVITFLDEFIQSQRKNIVDYIRSQCIKESKVKVWNSYQRASKRNLFYEHPQLCKYILENKKAIEFTILNCLCLKCELIEDKGLLGQNTGFTLQIQCD